MFGRLTKEQLLAVTRDGIFSKNTEMPIEDLPEEIKLFLREESSDFNHGYLSALTSLVLVFSEAKGDLLNKGLTPEGMSNLLFRLQGMACFCAMNVLNNDYPEEYVEVVTGTPNEDGDFVAAAAEDDPMDLVDK